MIKDILNSRLWQVGLEGILEDKVTKNMDNEKLARATKWVIRGVTATSLAFSAWACNNGWIPVDQTSEPTPTTEIVPPIEVITAHGVLTEITNPIEKAKVIDSLPEDRPKAKYGDNGTDVFQITTTNTTSRFAMYELSDEELRNGVAIMLDDEILIQSVALYTEKTDLDNKTTWERLVAVTVPLPEDSSKKNIVWLYNEDGFPTEEFQVVKTERPVLAYPIPNTTGRVLFSPLLSDTSLIQGWDGYNPFYVDIQSGMPGGFKVSANITHIETPTPEYPAIPQEIMDKLPAKWNTVQTAGVWYIVDQSTNSNIYRFSEGGKWQERHDVTVGETTYEGWIKDHGQKDMIAGENVRMDKIILGRIDKYQVDILPIPHGYLTEYQIVEITDGSEKMDLAFFTMRYFYDGGKTLDILFSADNKSIMEGSGYEVDLSKELGERYDVNALMPMGQSFSETAISTFSINTKTDGLRKQIKYYGSGEWFKAQDLLAQLQNPQVDTLDLRFKILISYLSSH
ncbi:MAG: hypothetical protein UR39_C0002G0165 [Candidatus Woesebacteria bacterium GW2011_GWA1_33_30]|uniref:Uncharacterized protein n=1 Tax=Candidatus Woesebacteria bacterium GW2011_GWA2_33_28 TaxID=1618561 RepID=A0A0G0CXC1_9BACT|nr:MAG: hypothetical protein UR38_C0002G0165 [Candidatus Woesebacteria bacterium GW2011_GWA2_33_28]KKP48875.1 MAG: hypothetical protein UR39_C0002G0165 [Candidatus Woesebacteria bacterium GW2011_GWA1_33_30]KKP50148.1 MAG: hypothetical protein UR40_C0002G0165 [Microgenomates group bacterium GW2011_GWC1_33_32]KKP51918.1 MAG: hypothetical protein UR44_C0006G0164 [Candidatus Woesebacteria bacterium GW2011_GWB1_33_38]KKP56970.1 MAG: hypothetical protein UR48_C0025G0002 [Microgenomates group bacteriu